MIQKSIEMIEKKMTGVCFEACFRKRNMKLDFSCVTNCYHKFLFGINELNNVTRAVGREVYSEHVLKSHGEYFDPLYDEVFKVGGVMVSKILRKRLVEIYMYSDPATKGR